MTNDQTKNVSDLSVLLAARVSERDSAQLALAAAMAAVEDTTDLLDSAQSEVRRIETEINDLRVSGESSDALESNAHEARDTVTQCEVAVHEASRVVNEYREEVNRLDLLVRELEGQMRAGE